MYFTRVLCTMGALPWPQPWVGSRVSGSEPMAMITLSLGPSGDREASAAPALWLPHAARGRQRELVRSAAVIFLRFKGCRYFI